MAKAKRPVSVAGIEFDALISSDHKLEATVPEYAVETGYTVSDAIILKQETLSMVLYLTDTPVTWFDKHGTDKGRVKNICSKLEELYYKATPIKIVTSDKTYSNMVIESLTISKKSENGYAREIPISFRKLRTTSTKTATIPSGYGKAGKTNQSSGTASTSSKSSNTKKTSSNNSKTTSKKTSSLKSNTSSKKTSSSSKSGSKSSILYSVGRNVGLIK